MKLAIFNGSPRGKKSNSKLLMDKFLAGYNNSCSEPVPIHYMANIKLMEEGKEIFRNAETIIIIFPLYTDCMPGIVKEFFEAISTMDDLSRKKIGYIVQSGFPEAIHSVYVERYLKKLTMRLKGEYLGTIIKGGVEGIQIMPPMMTKKLFNNFQGLGEYFAKTNTFSPDIKNALLKPFKMSSMNRFVFSTISKTGLTNFYWNKKLKENDAYEKRFDKPLK